MSAESDSHVPERNETQQIGDQLAELSWSMRLARNEFVLEVHEFNYRIRRHAELPAEGAAAKLKHFSLRLWQELIINCLSIRIPAVDQLLHSLESALDLLGDTRTEEHSESVLSYFRGILGKMETEVNSVIAIIRLMIKNSQGQYPDEGFEDYLVAMPQS